MIRQIRGSSTENKRKSCISRFQLSYIDIMKTYYEKDATPQRTYEIFLDTKQARDIYLEFVECLAETEKDYAEILAENFEGLFNQLTCIRTFDPNANSASDIELDIFHCHIWELFICVIAYMRYVQDYASINIMLTYTYFWKPAYLEVVLSKGIIRHSDIIAVPLKIIINLLQKRKINIPLWEILFVIKEKTSNLHREAIAEADLFLYQVCNAYDLTDEEQSWHSAYWFPTFYVYVKNVPLEWKK